MQSIEENDMTFHTTRWLQAKPLWFLSIFHGILLSRWTCCVIYPSNKIKELEWISHASAYSSIENNLAHEYWWRCLTSKYWYNPSTHLNFLSFRIKYNLLLLCMFSSEWQLYQNLLVIVNTLWLCQLTFPGTTKYPELIFTN